MEISIYHWKSFDQDWTVESLRIENNKIKRLALERKMFSLWSEKNGKGLPGYHRIRGWRGPASWWTSENVLKSSMCRRETFPVKKSFTDKPFPSKTELLQEWCGKIINTYIFWNVKGILDIFMKRKWEIILTYKIKEQIRLLFPVMSYIWKPA